MSIYMVYIKTSKVGKRKKNNNNTEQQTTTNYNVTNNPTKDRYVLQTHAHFILIVKLFKKTCKIA